MGFDYTHIPSFIAAIKEEQPYTTFLKDRYFPLGQKFTTDEVLVEYKDGNRKIAPFVAPRVGGVPVKRDGYIAKTFAPAYIAPTRPLTIDDLRKKRFGEAYYAQLTPEDRESEIMLDDANELGAMISRRENWMAAELLVNASCKIEEKTDKDDVTIEKEIIFYDGDANDWIYTPTVDWSDPTADILGDIAAMCNAQKSRGVAATELLLDSKAGDCVYNNEMILKLLDNRRIEVGSLDPKLIEYGVAEIGTFNCKGHIVRFLQYVEGYENDKTGEITPYLPDGTAILLAPNCGQTQYGAVNQLEDDDRWHTYAEERVPLILTDQNKQVKELRLASAPLLMPVKKHAWLTLSLV